MTVAWVQPPATRSDDAPAPDAGDLVFLQDAPGVALLEAPADEGFDAPSQSASPSVGASLEFLTFEDAPSGTLVDAREPEPLLEPLDLALPEPPSRHVAPAPAAAAAAAAASAPAPAEEHVDLGDWLRSEEPEATTRMTAAAPRQTEDENAAFAEALRAFKAGVARSVPDADFDSHYDLGIAYKEMGLLDEAIGALQKAARAPGRPLRAIEALGQCFLDRGEPALALAALDSVARELEAGRGADDASAVGVCYLLADACERLGRAAEARRWFVRVLAIDFTFRDAAPRLASLPAPD
jgi:tetratricopeptide (TPR) repeat protein